MPQLVAEVEHAAAIVPGEHAIVAVEVRDVGELDREAPILGFGHVAVHGRLDRAEVATERDLLLVAQRLVVEHEHRVAVHAGLDRRDLVGAERPAQVDAFDLADEERVQLADADRHVQSLHG